MEPFGYRVSKDGRVFVTFHGRQVVTVAGAKAERGNERRVNG
jgi:S-adenosylmethionine hydrolase